MSVEEFVRIRDCHIVVAPEVSVPLRIPTLLNLPAKEMIIQRPEGMPPTPEGFLHRVTSPPMTLTRLSDMVCIPGGVALRRPDTVLEESFNATWEKRLHHYLNILGDGCFSLKHDVTNAPTLEGIHLLLDFQHVPHYGHYIVDVLCRLWAFYFSREYLGIQPLRILISGTAHAGFVLPMLHAAGVPPGDITVIDQPVICEELFVATKAYQTQEYTSPAASTIWRRISDGFSQRQGGPARIYLSRSRYGLRVCTNEAEAEAIFVQHGFHVVHPQDLPVADQIDLVANAELVAGTSGSNMFNLAFQNRLRSAMILASPKLIHYTDQFLNAYRASDIRYFFGTPDTTRFDFDPINVHAAWVLDLNRLESEVANWLQEIG